MSDFRAKIIAELDTSKIPSAIAKIGNTKVNLTNVTVQNVKFNGSNLASEVQKALDSKTYTITVSKINVSGISNTGGNIGTNIAKQITNQINNGGIDAAVTKVQSKFLSLQKSLQNFGNFSPKSTISTWAANGTTALNQLEVEVKDVVAAQKQLVSTQTQMASGKATAKDLASAYENYSNKLQKVQNHLAMCNTEVKTFVSSMQVSKLDSQMSTWLNNNTKSGNQFRATVESLRNQLASLASSGQVSVSAFKNIQSQFQACDTQAKALGQTGKSLGDTFKASFQSIAGYVSVSTLIYQSIRALKEMASAVLEVDTAMTELYRVTDLTSSQYSALYDKMTTSAKAYGASLSDIINSTASWVRLGFDADTASDLSEISTMYQHVTDLDESTAVENLVTAYKGFQDELLNLYDGDATAAIEYVADIFDKLGNEYAVSAADVGDALVNCASALDTAGNSIQETAAMATGITEVTQDASKAGNALRTLSLRLRGTSVEELEALGEDTEGLITVTSKLQDKIHSLTNVDLVDSEGQLRSTYDIMRDLAGVWDDLDTNTQANVLETISGKNRASDIAALLANWEQVESAMQAATDAEGTAAAENEIYMNSLQGHLDTLSASWQAFANTFMKSDFLKGLVDSATTLLNVLDSVVGTFGTLPTILTAISAGLSLKNVGRDKCFPYYNIV